VTEIALRDLLDRWKAAVEAHDPAGTAALFTPDAVFQGLHPYTVGRPGIADYYDSQPIGMTADYRILETRQFADDLLYAYLAVDFGFLDMPTRNLFLGVLAQRVGGEWLLAAYQISRL
jgi:uncharacterized protein (TIGR02246 family)